jgi:hypothetical protein
MSLDAIAVPILTNYLNLPLHQEQRPVNVSHLSFWQYSRRLGVWRNGLQRHHGRTSLCCSPHHIEGRRRCPTVGKVNHVVRRRLPNAHLPLPDHPETTMLLSIRLQSVEWGAHGRENEKARKLNGTSSDPPLGPPVPNWLPRQLLPLAVMNGRTCRVEPIDSARHGAALYAAYATDREGRLWTYLPWGPYSGPKNCTHRCEAEVLALALAVTLGPIRLHVAPMLSRASPPRNAPAYWSLRVITRSGHQVVIFRSVHCPNAHDPNPVNALDVTGMRISQFLVPLPAIGRQEVARENLARPGCRMG